MKFVIDTNIIFSAILNSSGKVSDLLLNSHQVFEFYSCETLFQELLDHQDRIKDISGLTQEQLNQSIRTVTSRIAFTNEALIPFEHWQKSAKLVSNIDMDDVAFLALAEFIGAKLWTGDKAVMKGLAKKGYTNFISTEELFNLRTLLE